jgi:hypothetical protein
MCKIACLSDGFPGRHKPWPGQIFDLSITRLEGPGGAGDVPDHLDRAEPGRVAPKCRQRT